MNFKKNIIIVGLYWLIIVIIPAIFAFLLKDKESTYSLASGLSLFVVFIAPFLFVVPYMLIKVKEKSKIPYLFWGLILPYLIIYLFFFIEFKKNFHPGF